MTEANRAKLEKILQEVEGRVLVVDHEFSDLDGIASKYTWGYILREKFGLEYDIAFSNEIGHHKTQAMLKKLDSFYNEPMLDMNNINLDDYAVVMLLDVNLSSGNTPFNESQLNKLDKEKVIVIDHHEKKDEENEGILYEDITESGLGSTSIRTIEYLKEFGIEFAADNEEHSLLATSLWLGYMTDVRGKDRNRRDHDALSHIIERVSVAMREEIDRGARPELAQRALGKALSEYEIIGPYAVAYAGEIKAEHKDIIAIIAEELLKGQGVEASIAWGMLNGVPQGSVRTEPSSHLSAPKIAQMFGGNGRPNSAGFNGDYGFLSKYKEEDKQIIIDLTHKIILRTIKAKEE